MTEDSTALDAAHGAMTGRPEDDSARLAYYQRVADTELVLLLDAPPDAEGNLRPSVFATSAGAFVLAFDGEARLAAFTGRATDYASMSGRQIVRLLAGGDTGLGLNLGAASESLLPPEALNWLAGMLDSAPVETVASPGEIGPPKLAQPALLAALDAKLAMAGALAEAAWLCGSRATDGSEALLVVISGAAQGAEAALAKAAGEALAFSGVEGIVLDVAFTAPNSVLAERASRVGLRYELALPEAPAPERAAPGSDPERPPILR